MYDSRGNLVRGSYDIPEGDHPVVYVPLFEFQRTVKELALNARKRMSEDERKKHQRDSLARYRAKRREERQQGVDTTPRHVRVLSDVEVMEVRELKARGYKNAEIARMKGVSDSLISRIVNGRRRTRVAA